MAVEGLEPGGWRQEASLSRLTEVAFSPVIRSCFGVTIADMNSTANYRIFRTTVGCRIEQQSCQFSGLRRRAGGKKDLSADIDAFHKQDQSISQQIRIVCPQSAHFLPDPLTDLLLQTGCFLTYGMFGLGILDNRVGQRAAAIARLSRPPGQVVEIGQKLYAGVIRMIVADRVDPIPEYLLTVGQVRRRQAILGFKSAVKGRLGHPCPVHNFIHTNGTDPMIIEQFACRTADFISSTGTGCSFVRRHFQTRNLTMLPIGTYGRDNVTYRSVI